MPHNFEALFEAIISSNVLVCPSSGHRPGSFTNASFWADYILIDWSKILATNAVPNDYPLVYDRYLDNHRGGINILRVDGYVLWDTKGDWLKKFAAKNPDYRLDIPKDK